MTAKKSQEQISRNMSRVRSSGSKIERTLGKALWADGIRYRKQYKKVPGRPDFALVGLKVAIFCDSAFWHGRGYPGTRSQFKSNRGFWLPKIQRNIARDEQVNLMLGDLGWVVVRFWDDQILRDTAGCVRVVRHAMEQRRLRVNHESTTHSRD
jgi:DNA mismatch endonuclease (patch repair protein)